MRAAALSAPKVAEKALTAAARSTATAKSREMKRIERVLSGASALLSAFIWSSP